MKVYLVVALGLFSDGTHVCSAYLNSDKAEDECEKLNKKEKAKQYPYYVYKIDAVEVKDE